MTDTLDTLYTAKVFEADPVMLTQIGGKLGHRVVAFLSDRSELEREAFLQTLPLGEYDVVFVPRRSDRQ